MKKLIRQIIWLLIIGVVFIACNKDEEFNETQERTITELPEAKEISLKRAEEMVAFQLVEKEQELDYDSTFPINNSDGDQNDYLQYDFNAKVTSGPAEGVQLAADLKLKFTVDFDTFKVFRGVLDIDTDTRVRVSGVFINEEMMYLFTMIPELGYIRGVGNVDANGVISGPFQLTNENTNSMGEWSANPNKPELNLLQTVENNPDLSTFTQGIRDSNLFGALQGEGDFTVFAPTNDAFEALDSIPDGEALREVLLYHLVPETFDTDALIENRIVTTTQGSTIRITDLGNGTVFLNGFVEIQMANIEATNGIIHVINRVLIPPSGSQFNLLQTIENNPDLSAFTQGIRDSNLFGALQGEGDFTVFAPTNEAFEALDTIPEGEALREVLLYHLAPGAFDTATLVENGSVTTTQQGDITIEMIDGKVILNGTVEVTLEGIEATNGIIHVINGVLIP